MKRLVLVSVICGLSGLVGAGLTVFAAGQENVPGYPTMARMFVLNRARAEAVPVTVHSAGDVLPVTVMNMPPMSLAANATVVTRSSRQLWEYRQLRVTTNDDAAAALNGAGADGWEAIGAASAGTVTVWTLKRPR